MKSIISGTPTQLRQLICQTSAGWALNHCPLITHSWRPALAISSLVELQPTYFHLISTFLLTQVIITCKWNSGTGLVTWRWGLLISKWNFTSALIISFWLNVGVNLWWHSSSVYESSKGMLPVLWSVNYIWTVKWARHNKNIWLSLFIFYTYVT